MEAATQEPAVAVAVGSENVLAMVLKAPKTFADLVVRDEFGWRSSLIVLAAAAAFDAAYGLAMGMFSGGHAIWLAALKVPLIAVASLSLCAPSLYVLLGLSGSPVGLRQVAAILSGSACLASMLLVGFAPVAWLFGVSTTNVQFMILLHIGVFAVGVGYGLRLLGSSVPRGFSGNRVLAVWAAVFLLVCAQMLTYFRPLLAVSENGFRDDQKRFFFEHFLDSMRSGDGRAVAEQVSPSTDSAALVVPSADQLAMQDPDTP
ncbi:MAG TPA: hypothetical protein VG125_18435 [Pirellulales bacterium]|jgi:hypothetical protein|nr:hypothetical protein [Pirellulales bacterium]